MDNHMTPARLAEIQARVDAATDGNWICSPAGYISQSSRPFHVIAFVGGSGEQCVKDAVFICESRTDIPDLLAEVARLTAELAQTKRERDAAIHDIKLHPCDSCNFEKKDAECRGRIFGLGEDACHEWRGPCEENAKEVEIHDAQD